jgi:hypothetical protein
MLNMEPQNKKAPNQSVPLKNISLRMPVLNILLLGGFVSSAPRVNSHGEVAVCE